MSWHKGQGGGERGYHHGDLRAALIKAALGLIQEKGPHGFSFAEAARAAGVSPAAPYRHFKNRDELMADVAQEGFERLEAAMALAWDGGRPKPGAAFERVGKAPKQSTITPIKAVTVGDATKRLVASDVAPLLVDLRTKAAEWLSAWAAQIGQSPLPVANAAPALAEDIPF